jgi:hypothetical protein
MKISLHSKIEPGLILMSGVHKGAEPLSVYLGNMLTSMILFVEGSKYLPGIDLRQI